MRDEQTVALNRRARHDFTIDETFEAGVVLTELRAADGAGLEEMFLELTADTQREGAAA